MGRCCPLLLTGCWSWLLGDHSHPRHALSLPLVPEGSGVSCSGAVLKLGCLGFGGVSVWIVGGLFQIEDVVAEIHHFNLN
jgi:hypothetical protein